MVPISKSQQATNYKSKGKICTGENIVKVNNVWHYYTRAKRGTYPASPFRPGTPFCPGGPSRPGSPGNPASPLAPGIPCSPGAPMLLGAGDPASPETKFNTLNL